MKATKHLEPCDEDCLYASSVSGCCFSKRREYCFKDKPPELTELFAKAEMIKKVEELTKLLKRTK